jgi:hypothetical protein
MVRSARVVGDVADIDDAGVEAIVAAIRVAEGHTLEAHAGKESAWLEGLVRDWLFDPAGRGARSGLA